MPASGVMTRAGSAVVLGALVAGALLASLASDAEDAGARSKQPNVIVITTDDQDAASFRRSVMPNVVGEIGDRGTVFEAGFSSPPLCCPSRAGFLTGQYPHNHRVFDNNPGYPALESKQQILPRWLQSSGYRTGFVGKFLNGYSRSNLKGRRPAPGFKRWYAVHKRKRYYDYEMTINGRIRHFGNGKRDYLSKVITGYSKSFIRRSSRKDRPFFLWTSYWAPHFSKDASVKGPCDRLATPGPGDERAFSDARLPRGPSFDEKDVSDKPSFIRSLPRIAARGKPRIGRIERGYRCRLASLLKVDRGVRSIVKALERSGELGDTVLVFTSDNGFYHGEHRVPDGKSIPYEPAIRVPLAISVPAAYRDGPRVATASQPVSNVDLAPTILDLARADPCKKGKCRTLDGRSLVPLLSEGGGRWPEDRGVLLEARGRARPCRYEAIRTERYFYAEHGSPTKSGGCRRASQMELYDLAEDPDELENLDPAPPGSPLGEVQRELADRLDALRKCSGSARGGGAGSRCE